MPPSPRQHPVDCHPCGWVVGRQAPPSPWQRPSACHRRGRVVGHQVPPSPRQYPVDCHPWGWVLGHKVPVSHAASGRTKSARLGTGSTCLRDTLLFCTVLLRLWPAKTSINEPMPAKTKPDKCRLAQISLGLDKQRRPDQPRTAWISPDQPRPAQSRTAWTSPD